MILIISACTNDVSSPKNAQQVEPQPSRFEYDPFEATENKQVLRIITQESIHTFQRQATKSNKKQGFEYSLLKKFAKAEGIKLEVILAKNEQSVLLGLDEGMADLAMLGQPLSQNQIIKYEPTSSYADVTTQLIYRHGTGKPTSFEDLIGKRVLARNLEHNHDKYGYLRQQYMKMHWEFTEADVDEILQSINNGDADYAILASHEFLELSAKYPHTRIAYDLYYPEGLGFALSHRASEQWIDKLDNFIDTALNNNTVDHLTERYQGHIDHVNPLGSLTFFKRVDRRLPNYMDLMEQVASDYAMDWRLLAAIAYQESHWNPNAKSPTGVRGMMMLTLETAKHMGIENRLSLSQSLKGGARYFNHILKRLPDDIKEPDRTWFALAAYNVGLGHVYDARKITEFHGANPSQWADVKQYLPLLENKDWYQYTKYGKARGTEPVNYVQNIRQFYDLLEWRFPVKDINSAAPVIVKELEDVINDKHKEAKAIQLEQLKKRA